MFEFERIDQLFQIVRGSSYTPAAKLSDMLGVTVRTIRSDVASANATLERHGASIEMKRGSGYYLNIHDDEGYREFLASYRDRASAQTNVNSAADRLCVVLNTLVSSKDYVSIRELADEVYVGEETLRDYIKQARDIMLSYNIECISSRERGLKTFGHEADRRRCIVNEAINRDVSSYVTGFTAAERRLFPSVDIAKLTQVVKASLAECEVSGTDYGIKNLLIHCALMIQRIGDGCPIDATHMADITCGNKTIETLCSRLEREFSIEIPQAERDHLYLHLESDTDISVSQIDSMLIKEKIDQILELIGRDYGLDLRGDNELYLGLLNHLSSIFRNRNRMSGSTNPLLNTIRRNFPLAYEVSLVSVNEVFASDSITFSEDEIGYIALHIGAAIERHVLAQDNASRVLLVCGEGRAAASMLETRVSTLFGNHLQIVSTTSFQGYLEMPTSEFDHIDFIISTVPLKEGRAPSILVDFRLSAQDVKSLSRYIEDATTVTPFRAEPFFDASSFMIIDEPIERDALLQLLSENLVKQGIADEGLYESILEREKIASTALSESVVLPHPLKPCAHRTRVGVAILRRPLKWNASDAKMSIYSGIDYTGMRVQLVFLLALSPRDTAAITSFYDMLINVVNNERITREIIGATDFSSFISALRKAS